MVELDVRDYLERTLPELLGSAPPDRSATIQVVILDRDDCDRTYRIDAQGISISHEVAEDADLTLAFVSADLSAFSRRALDIDRAIRTRRLRVLGDPELLLWMAARMEGAAR